MLYITPRDHKNAKFSLLDGGWEVLTEPPNQCKIQGAGGADSSKLVQTNAKFQFLNPPECTKSFLDIKKASKYGTNPPNTGRNC